MNDDRLDHYQNNASIRERAKEFVEQDRRYQSEIDTLKTRQTELSNRYDRQVNDLKDMKTDTQQQRAEYDKLAKESQQTFEQREETSKSLQQKQAEYDRFQEEYRENSPGQETDTIQKGKIEEQGKPADSSPGKLDRTMAEGIESTQQGPGNNHQDKSGQPTQPGNDPRIDAARQKAFEEAKEVKQEFEHSQSRERDDPER